MRGLYTSSLFALTVALLALSLASTSARAQLVEVPDDGAVPEDTAPAKPAKTGKAEEYMRDRKGAAKRTRTSAKNADGTAPRYLDVHIGGFFDSQGYKWGHGDQYKSGKFNAGIDYRLGEWINSADFMLRVDFTNYSLEEGNARKLSINGIVTFPDANSHFPLYFGAGLGPGFFLKQIHNQSVLALDYSILAGVRFLNVIDNLGFLFETGIKDHIHLFSEGQFNGIYVNIGTVWLF